LSAAGFDGVTNMTKRIHQHLFPIVNQMMTNAIKEAEEEGYEIQCRQGCDHCCHLLIEISWEEAVEMAHAVVSRPRESRLELIGRIQKNAQEAREFFLGSKGAAAFARPVEGDRELPDDVYDDYFYKGVRPCPFLENSSCTAYESRPTPCRLHVVSSDPKLCENDVEDDSEYETPECIEQVKEDLGPVIETLEVDDRWGHFSIVLEAVLMDFARQGVIDGGELGLNRSTDATVSEAAETSEEGGGTDATNIRTSGNQAA
jgi:Fe-S-cluster containining protein